MTVSPDHKHRLKNDMVFYNGVIYTADSSDNIVEALAVKNGKIVFTGSNKEAEKILDGAAEIIDLEGKMLLPGFIDAHIHAPGRALTDLFNISLYEAHGQEAIIETVERYIKRNPELEIYYGEGFSIGAFREDEVSRGPKKEHLDRICSTKPIVLYSSDCHLAWLNSKAFEFFGITGSSPSPRGGVIEKDPLTGELWGTLKEAAMRLIPEQKYDTGQVEEAMRLFQQYLHSLGYTGILSVSMASAPPLEAIRSLEKKENLKLYVSSTVTIDPEKDLNSQFDQIQELRAVFSTDLHSVNTAKFFADGVVEGATAYLLEPYSAAAGKGSDYCGEFLWDPDKLKEAFLLANSAGLQVHVHSIGDASTRYVLNALEQVRKRLPGRDYRNTITHLQLVEPSDISRFRKMQVIAAIQPYWHYKEPGWWEAVDYHMLGERAEREYPLQSFLRAGVVVVSSSDHPVTPDPNPLKAIRAGVTRNLTAEESYGVDPIEDIDDPRGLLNKVERSSLTDMIRSFTAGSAYALFRDDVTGSLEAGKNADLIILDQNLFTTEPLLIDKVRVLKTYFNGELVFNAGE